MDIIKSKIGEKIENIIGRNIGDNIEELSLIYDLELSSLDMLLLIVELEKEFNITIDEKEIYNISSIKKLIELINKLSQK